MIETTDLQFAYDNPDGPVKFVLDGVTLTVATGSFVGVLGRNGSGKSTFARHCNAMLLPTGGQVLVDGIDARDEARAFDIRRTVGLVLQNPDNQLVSTIVEDDVAFGPENLGVPPAEIRQRVDEALAAVGMTEYAGHAPDKLSGGQKQRVAIAGMLAMRPDCLVLDEPTAMLDPKGRREVLDVVHKLNKERGMTVVFITHNMEEVTGADRVLVMDAGRVVLDGTPREVFFQVDTLRELGLDVPQPAALCYALGLPAALTVEECAAALEAALALE
ncbi:MAG: energy-coupling factor transporter ATPase, partial [Oscillospiraceae bacterium]|nr:energy-coupling factor transporter ATPase [Oscillospiraceae bacterium]